MHSDPIADMLTRVRNAQAVNKTTTVVNYSKINVAILNLLKENGYIKEVIVEEYSGITVKLSYTKEGKPKISHLKRISTPGRRVYVQKDRLPRVLNNYGLAILSTSRGLMTNKEAAKSSLGGEVICEIY